MKKLPKFGNGSKLQKKKEQLTKAIGTQTALETIRNEELTPEREKMLSRSERSNFYRQARLGDQVENLQFKADRQEFKNKLKGTPSFGKNENTPKSVPEPVLKTAFNPDLTKIGEHLNLTDKATRKMLTDGKLRAGRGAETFDVIPKARVQNIRLRNGRYKLFIPEDTPGAVRNKKDSFGGPLEKLPTPPLATAKQIPTSLINNLIDPSFEPKPTGSAQSSFFNIQDVFPWNTKTGSYPDRGEVQEEEWSGGLDKEGFLKVEPAGQWKDYVKHEGPFQYSVKDLSNIKSEKLADILNQIDKIPGAFGVRSGGANKLRNTAYEELKKRKYIIPRGPEPNGDVSGERIRVPQLPELKKKSSYPIEKSSDSGYRTDRHNNPTAFITEIAKMAGLEEGKDYAVGEPFPDNKNLYTARLLKDPVPTTVKVIDRVGFYTQTGQPRWDYIENIPEAREWKKLTYNQKAEVIKKMYQQFEGGSRLLPQFKVQ